VTALAKQSKNKSRQIQAVDKKELAKEGKKELATTKRWLDGMT
jgi:hypothetical protein